MPLFTLFAFILLTCSFISLWIKREPKVWGTLLGLSILSGLIAGNITPLGLVFIACLTILWFFYDRKPNIALFITIIAFSLSFKLRLLSGYSPYFITERFAIGLKNPLIGLFPLALLVPLAKNWLDFKDILKGLAFGLAGIAILALLATIAGATHWDFKLPSHFGARVFSNLILTSIPEEGFYRGFIQKTFSKTFKNTKLGNLTALILTSLIFAGSHIFWSPNISILAFSFLASLLYGSVYLYSRKIESAILCHFLFNLIHMTFFSYHAM